MDDAVFTVPVQIRPTDIVGGHINNILFLLYCEVNREQWYLADVERRVADAHALGIPSGATVRDLFLTETSVRVSNVRAEYRRGGDFSTEPLDSRSWVSRIGRSSFDLSYELRSVDGDVDYVVMQSGLVLLSRETERPVPLGAAQRAVLESWRGEPLTFR